MTKDKEILKEEIENWLRTIYPKSNVKWNIVQDAIEKAISITRQAEQKRILELLDNWQHDTILTYESECPYCLRNINILIIKVKEFKKEVEKLYRGRL
jgi:hypothetical protein